MVVHRQKALESPFFIFFPQLLGAVRKNLGERSCAVSAFHKVVKRRAAKAFYGLHAGDLRIVEIIVLGLALILKICAGPVRTVQKPLFLINEPVPFCVKEAGNIMIRTRLQEIHKEEHFQLMGNIGLVRMDFSAGTAILIIVHQGVGHVEDPADSGPCHGVVRVGRVIEERNVRQRIYCLYPEARGFKVVAVPCRPAHGEAQVLVSHARPFLEVPGGNQVDRVFVREGIVAEIAHVLEGAYVPLKMRSGLPYCSLERQR